MFRFFSSRTRSLIYSTSCYRDRFGSPFETIDLFKKMAEEGKLGMRLWVMIRDSNELLQEKLPEYKIIGMADNHLTVRAIKRSFDGALGPHGAWLLEPYKDLPTSVELNTTPIDAMKETARMMKF